MSDIQIKNKKYAIIISVLAVALLVVSVYAVIMLTITVNMTFRIKQSYSLGLYSDSACTIPLTTLTYEFNATDEEIAVEAWIRNNGNTAVKVSYNCTMANYNSGNGQNYDGYYVFVIDRDNSERVLFRSEEDLTPDLVTLNAGGILHIWLVGKSQTSNPLQTSSPTLYFNSNNV